MHFIKQQLKMCKRVESFIRRKNQLFSSFSFSRLNSERKQKSKLTQKHHIVEEHATPGDWPSFVIIVHGSVKEERGRFTLPLPANKTLSSISTPIVFQSTHCRFIYWASPKKTRAFVRKKLGFVPEKG